MSLDQFALWLDATPPSLALKNNAFAIPVVQSIHILGVAFVFSGSAILCLRSYGVVGVDRTLREWEQRLSLRLWFALAALLASGALLVLAEPTRELVNRAFQVKLILLMPTVAFAIWLARRQLRADGAAPVVDRAASAAMVVLWAAIASAGRWIGYI